VSTDGSEWERGPRFESLAGVALVLVAVVAVAAFVVFWLLGQPSSQGSPLPPGENVSGAEGRAAGTSGEASTGERPQPGVANDAPSPGAGLTDRPERTTPPAAGERVNILLLGLDERPGQRGTPTRSDTIILVSIDTAAKRAAMISFPRDLYVEIPGFGHDRLGHANAFGDAQGYPGGGPALAMRTVEHNFGVEIDYYARIEFEGFKRMVDTLGGVTVHVESPIVDPGNPIDPNTGAQNVYIPAGTQHLDGDQALMYARSREGDDDFGRAERQQRLLLAIFDKAASFDSVVRLPSLVRTAWEMVDTDIPPHRLLSLANLARGMDRSDINTLVLAPPRYAVPFTSESGAYLLEPNHQEIREGVARATGQEAASTTSGSAQGQVSPR
jgi:polyisoprenyl-teichoic acid--peptidoglycan teichoic acid transferase